MLFKETVAAYCENHTEHTDTLCGQNAEFKDVKIAGIYSNHWDLNSSKHAPYSYHTLYIFVNFSVMVDAILSFVLRVMSLLQQICVSIDRTISPKQPLTNLGLLSPLWPNIYLG
jgi:hypothetical protein